jgi:hypothetical protein
MISFLVGESGFMPSRLLANGSGGDGHVSFFVREWTSSTLPKSLVIR